MADDKITITIRRGLIDACLYFLWQKAPQSKSAREFHSELLAAIAEVKAQFQCQRCHEITPAAEQCYDESADIYICPACSRELTRLDEGEGRYIPYTEAEEGRDDITK